MAKPRVIFVVGTRPDAIKSAPVIKEFLSHANLVETMVVSTGQHKEMLEQALNAFELKANVDLAVMSHGQSLAQVTQKVLGGLDTIIEEFSPDMVFAQGDTTTTFVAGLASFYRQIKFAHIEAGLRTETVWNPFPEEFNRRAVGLFADLHFPPTRWAAENLCKEGFSADSIFVTGNSGIDAVMQTAASHSREWYENHTGRIVLLTTHRRENWGEPQRQIAEAAKSLLNHGKDILLVVPMHRNPVVRETLEKVLADHPQVDLIEPPDYADFVKLMQRADLILTDSGGVQEEAPTFGKPVLVLRDTTERPEGVDAGTAKLVGTNQERITEEASLLLNNPEAFKAMAQAVSPYGDGNASARIRYIALKRLLVESEPVKMWI